METPIITRQIAFDTQFSANKNTTSPVWILPQPITALDSFSVRSFIGINSVYNIDQRNNKLSLVARAFGSTVSSTSLVTIPEGNYTVSRFTTELASLLTNTSVGTYTVTNNTTSNKLSISAGTSCSFAFTQVGGNCYYELGIRDTQLASTHGSLTAADQYDFSGLKVINVVSPNFGGDSCQVAGCNTSLLASVPVTEPYNSVIVSQQDAIPITSDAKAVSALSVQLLDERFRPLSNMKDWCLLLIVRTV